MSLRSLTEIRDEPLQLLDGYLAGATILCLRQRQWCPHPETLMECEPLDERTVINVLPVKCYSWLN